MQGDACLLAQAIGDDAVEGGRAVVAGDADHILLGGGIGDEVLHVQVAVGLLNLHALGQVQVALEGAVVGVGIGVRVGHHQIDDLPRALADIARIADREEEVVALRLGLGNAGAGQQCQYDE